jgi:hypothetical protein
MSAITCFELNLKFSNQKLTVCHIYKKRAIDNSRIISLDQLSYANSYNPLPYNLNLWLPSSITELPTRNAKAAWCKCNCTEKLTHNTSSHDLKMITGMFLPLNIDLSHLLSSNDRNAVLIDNNKPISLAVEILMQDNLSSSLHAKGKNKCNLTLSDQLISVPLKHCDLLCQA